MARKERELGRLLKKVVGQSECLDLSPATARGRSKGRSGTRQPAEVSMRKRKEASDKFQVTHLFRIHDARLCATVGSVL